MNCKISEERDKLKGKTMVSDFYRQHKTYVRLVKQYKVAIITVVYKSRIYTKCSVRTFTQIQTEISENYGIVTCRSQHTFVTELFSECEEGPCAHTQAHTTQGEDLFFAAGVSDSTLTQDPRHIWQFEHPSRKGGGKKYSDIKGARTLVFVEPRHRARRR